MVTKTTGISRDLIIHPGETISDILETRNITQAELAFRTGVSPTFVANVISGKKAISNKFAMALEYALGISKSFWLNLQARYETELLEFEEKNTISKDENDIYTQLKDVVKHLKKCNLLSDNVDTIEGILSLRRLFKLNSLCNLKNIPAFSNFRMNTNEKINPYILGAWIRMCQLDDCNDEKNTTFDPNNIDVLINELKYVMMSDSDDFSELIKDTLRKHGIDFQIVKNFRGAPVQGFIFKRADNSIKICITLRFAFADIFWFSLFHEIGHLYNGDISKSSQFIDDGTDKLKEDNADKFASNKLLDETLYKKFIMQYKESPSFEIVQKFALSQRVKPYIVIGRMQREKIISYQTYHFAKTRYKWINK